MRNYPASFYLLIIAVWSFVSGSVWAQQFPIGLPEIKNFTSKDYQWHPRNFSVAQGRNGLIYVGNSYGILEYDGKMWRKIMLPNGLDGHTFGITDNGQLMVGSFNEFGTLIHQPNGITAYKSLSSRLSPFKQNVGEIRQIWVNKDITILRTQQSVYCYENDSLSALVSSTATIPFSQLDGQYLYFQENNTLFRKDLDLNTVDQRTAMRTTLAGIVVISGDTLAVSENGVFHNISAGTFTKPKDLPKDLQVRRVLQLRAGQIAMASANRGLIILNSSLNVMHHIDSQHGLLSDKIFDLHEDLEGNLWLALDNGVSHITLHTPFTFYGQTSGVRGMGYTSALFQNQLYLGTSQGAFTHNRTGEFTLVEGSAGQVYELRSINDKLLMAHESGLFQLAHEKFKPIISTQHVWCVRQVPGFDQLLIIGTDHGLELIDLTNGQFEKVSSLNGFTESSRVMEFDADQKLWICHGNKGLYRLTIDFEQNEVAEIEFYSQQDDTLPVYVSFVSPSKEGLLFSAQDGVYQFNPSTKSFEPNERINTFLQHNYYVDKIVEGTYGNLWIIQDNKISKLDLLDNGNYTLLPENIITELSGNLVGSYEHLYVYDSNNVVIGTQEGFAQFNVQANIDYRINRQKSAYNTVIREVKFERPDSSFVAASQTSSAVLLPHEFSNITLTYAPGYFQSREPIKFSFYLETENSEGEPDWSDWHASNQNSFKNLAPGPYTFHVRSRGDLIKASQPTSYSFVIQRPWYTTQISLIIYTLCIMLIGFIIYKIRIRKIKQEKQEALLQKDEELRQQKLIADGEKMKLINERLKEKVTLKNKELGSVALEITRKNEFLGQLKKNLTQLSSALSNDSAHKLNRTVRSIDQNMRSDNNWERFEHYFDESHQDFIRKLKEKQPALTKSSINLCAFLKLDLSTKEIASLMNISVSGVEKRRYRLRKKLNLATDTNLREYLESI